MFTMNLFACYCHLDSRSREKEIKLKIPRSIAYLFNHAQCSNSWRSRVPNLWGGGGPGAKTVTYIWRSQGRDCNEVAPRDITTGHTSRLPSLAALGNHLDVEIKFSESMYRYMPKHNSHRSGVSQMWEESVLSGMEEPKEGEMHYYLNLKLQVRGKNFT